jgi:AGZA family xanthine/uracil permease-like MFS transporter
MNLKSFFEMDKRNTDLKTEIIAGITTFLTMSYIIVVNPMILKKAGMSFEGVLFATVLISALSSILMGIYANLPYALAPGMGINAFFTFTMVQGMGVSWQTALGAVFISGIIFIVLSITKIRTWIVYAIPLCLRYAVAAGIGLFIALIGLAEVGFIKSGTTIVSFGGFNAQTVLFLVGLIIASILVTKRIKGALLFSILINSAIAIFFSYITLKLGWLKQPIASLPTRCVALPNTEVFLKLDILGVFKWNMVGPLFTLLFTDMFDSLSTFLGVAQVSGLIAKDGQPLNINKALMVDALGTTFSGLFGTSSATTYIESAAGVEEGGRTGLTAIVAGLLFIPFAFLSPLLSLIPTVAVSPVLVIVGVFMVQALKNINWKIMDEAIPSFVAFIMIPFTYSITQGIVWGFIVYTLVKIFAGKYRELNITLIFIDVFAILALVFMASNPN